MKLTGERSYIRHSISTNIFEFENNLKIVHKVINDAFLRFRIKPTT